MSLQRLFEDRKMRKYIRDGVNEAKDMGKGSCDCCDEQGYLIRAFGRNICEACAVKAFEMADDYDTVLESISNEDIIDFIKEGYILPDMKKLKADANAKFGGSIPELMKSYDLHVHKDWDDKITQGKIYIKRNDAIGGKSKINQFMIDYDAEFDTNASALAQVPDADGTMAPLRVKGQIIDPTTVKNASKPTAPKAANKPSVKGVSTSASSSNQVSAVKLKAGYISGNKDNFSIQIGGKEELECVNVGNNNGNYTYQVGTTSGNLRLNVLIPEDDYDDFDKTIKTIKAWVIQNPQGIFPAFKGLNSGEFEINKYGIYKFALDEYSFGNTLTMVPVYKGKKATKERIELEGKALSSVALLNAGLTEYMDRVIAKKFPVFASNQDCKVKTSLGTAIISLKDIEDNNMVRVSVEFANRSFDARLDGDRLKSIFDSREAFYEVLLNALYDGNQSIYNLKGGSLIPDLKNGKDKIDLDLEDDGRKFTAHAEFDWETFIGDGTVQFLMSVIDEHTGEEWPKKFEAVVYRKAGVNIKDFIKKYATEIYKKHFTKSNMSDTLTVSALNKLKSSSKKAALMDKLVSIWLKSVPGNSIPPELEEMEIEMDMKVNKDGKPNFISIKVTDPYAEYANDSKSLQSILGLEKGDTGSYIKFKKADATMKDGPSVSYEVSDIEEFSKLVQLNLLESAIFEAFGLVTVSESTNRKVFHV